MVQHFQYPSQYLEKERVITHSIRLNLSNFTEGFQLFSSYHKLLCYTRTTFPSLRQGCSLQH